MNLRILSSGIPVVVFFGMTRVAEPWTAVLAGFVVTAIVTYVNRRDRLIGLLAVYGFVILAVCAIIGIVSNDEKTFLASGPIGDFLFVPLYLGSILVGRPIIGGIVRELFPVVALHVPEKAPMWAWLTLAWALSNLGQGFLRLWLLSNMSVGEYLVWSRLLAWPMSAAMIALTTYVVLAEARKHGSSFEAMWETWRGERQQLPASD